MTTSLQPPTTRYQVHGGALFAGIFRGARYVLAAIMSGRPTLKPLQSLPAFLDTLLPEDNSPSATQLGVDLRLVAMTRGRRKRRLLLKGCLWLDLQAGQRYGRKFHELDAAGREAIVASAATAAQDALQRTFFMVFRADAFGLYYLDSRG